MVVTVAAVYLVPPVYVRISVGITTGVKGVELVLGVLGCQTVKFAGLVHEVTVSVSVCELRGTEHLGHTVLVFGSNLKRSCLTALGGNENYSVAAANAVQRCRSRILKYLNRLYLYTCDV